MKNLKLSILTTIFSTTCLAGNSNFSNKFVGQYELQKLESTDMIWKCSRQTSISLNKSKNALKLETTFGFYDEPGNDKNYNSLLNFENKCDVESQEIMGTTYFDGCIKSSSVAWRVNRITIDSGEFRHNNYTQIQLAGFFADTLVITHGRISEMFVLRLFDEKPIVCTYKKIN